NSQEHVVVGDKSATVTVAEIQKAFKPNGCHPGPVILAVIESETSGTPDDEIWFRVLAIADCLDLKHRVLPGEALLHFVDQASEHERELMSMVAFGLAMTAETCGKYIKPRYHLGDLE